MTDVGKDSSFAAYAPEAEEAPAANPANTKTNVGGKELQSSATSDVEKEIAQAMPWLTPEELQALREEQERIDKSKSKVSANMEGAIGRAAASTKFARSGVEEIEFGDDEEFIDGKKANDRTGTTFTEKQSVQDGKFAGYAPDPDQCSDIPERTDNNKANKKASYGAATKKHARKGMQDDDEEAAAAAALPGAFSERQPHAAPGVGQWNTSNNTRSNSHLVGAHAIAGPGGPAVDRIEHGEATVTGTGTGTGTGTDESLISAELVTESSINPDDIREMLRSELQAELRNNIVRAEVLTPTPEDVSALPPPSEEETTEEETKAKAPPVQTKRRYYIIGAVLVLVVGAAASAGGALAATGGSGEPGPTDNADIVGGTSGSQNPTTTPAQVLPEPTLLPSSLGGDVVVSILPTAAPSIFATKPPTKDGETWPPTRSPTPWPTAHPSAKPTWYPTQSPWPTTRARWPTVYPSQEPTWPPTRPPTNAPTRPTLTNSPTRSPTERPTDEPTVDPDIQTGACPTVFDPVCGSDGKTYSNACEAGISGVSVVSQGPCPEEEQPPTEEPTVGPIIVQETDPPTKEPTAATKTDPPTKDPTREPTEAAPDPTPEEAEPEPEPVEEPVEEPEEEDENDAPDPTDEAAPEDDNDA